MKRVTILLFAIALVACLSLTVSSLAKEQSSAEEPVAADNGTKNVGKVSIKPLSNPEDDPFLKRLGFACTIDCGNGDGGDLEVPDAQTCLRACEVVCQVAECEFR